MPQIINIPHSCVSVSKWKWGYKNSGSRSSAVERHVLFVIVKCNSNQTQSVLFLILTNDSLGLGAEVGVLGGGGA